MFVQSTLCLSQDTDRKDLLIGVFDGRTPCQELAKYLNEQQRMECIKIKWRLTLYKDNPATNSGNYSLQGFVYKKDHPREGRWQIIKGTPSNPEAIVYRLEQEGEETLYLLKADDNILFFLDHDKNIMVGNRDFSYTLNRKQ
jgi:hypothetical protein